MPRLTRTNDAINRRGRSLATERDTALRAATKIGVRQEAKLANKRIDDLPLPENDEVAPLTPRNVRVEPLRRALRVTWDAPAEEEYVERTRVRVTNTMTTGGVLVQEDGAGTSTTVVDLPLEEHLVEVQHVDVFGLESPWSAWVSGTPLRAVADEIDLARAEILGKLGWDNLDALTDPANLGNDVVTSRAMATQNFAALSAWIEKAAIEDALIKNVKADTIDAGKLKVQLELVLGGKLTWPGGLLDDGGVTLGNLAKGTGALPHTSPASWITSTPDGETPSPASGLTFFRGSDDGQSYRGALLVGQGARGDASRSGMIRLLATTGSEDPTITASAYIDLKARSGGGFAVIRRDLSVERDASVGRNFAANGNLSLGGSAAINGTLTAQRQQWNVASGIVPARDTLNFPHGFGTSSLVVQAYYLLDGAWRDVASNGSGLECAWNSSSITVLNNTDFNRSIRFACIRCDF